MIATDLGNYVSRLSLLSKKLKIKIYRIIILPVILYGCETWSLTLREERRLRAFENRVLRRVFGPKRDEVTGEWRKLHNELELRHPCCVCNSITNQLVVFDSLTLHLT